jgi:hypothetical protein
MNRAAQNALELLRFDAVDTAHLLQELESVEQVAYETVYPEFKARRLIPPDTSDDPGAETVAYVMFDSFAMAEIIANHAGDLPMVEAFAKKFAAPVHSLGIGYQYSIQDLRRSALARRNGNPGPAIDQQKAAAARRGSEARLDEIAAHGDAAAGLGGFVNNANVTLVPEINGDWLNPATTPAEIMADMDELVSTVVEATMEQMPPDTLVLPTTRYNLVATRPVDTTNQRSILQVWLERNPWVKDVLSWHKLETANAAGTGPRMIAYRRDPMVLALKIPQEYETMPPQAKNLAFVVPAHMRTGGTVIRYPVAVAYMDDI